MSKILTEFYSLSEILGDDLELVAIVIHKYHPKKEKLSRVISDVEECGEERLEKYQTTISKILDLPYKRIKSFVANHNKGLFDEETTTEAIK